MYDNERLERSKFYFSVLQLLRIFSEWIIRSMEDMNLVADKCAERIAETEHYFHHDPQRHEELKNASKIIARNWDVVLALCRKEGKSLLDRVAHNIETVQSLRDGVRLEIPKHIPSRCANQLIASSSTHNQSARLSRTLESTSIYLSSPL